MEKLVYSFVSSKQSEAELNTVLAGIDGIAGARLSAVILQGVAVVFSDIQRASMLAARSIALEYAGVIEALSKTFNLLPVRFGSLMESTDAIKTMMENNFPDIKENLSKVENRLEFGLKVFCITEAIREKFQSRAETVILPGHEISGEPSVYRNYLEKKLKEHRIEEMILAHVTDIGKEITGQLAKLNPLHKFKKMPSSSNLIDAVFLLDKDRQNSLVDAVRDMQNQYPEFKFVLTGPWPPYSFVDITLK